jgi:DNA-binding transcriptional LysR family regulator
MTEPDWNDFKVVLALATGQSIAGAGRVLGVDGSTVSRRLAALEDCLGARLIVRGGQRFDWTAEGRAVLAAAEAIQIAVSDASRAVRSAKADGAAAVTVSCPPGIAAMITRLLSTMQEKRPQLSLQLSVENRSVDLAKGEAHVAIRMFRPTEPSLICRRAFELGWAVFASSSYLAEHGWPAAPSDLGSHRLVRYVNALHKVAGPRWLEEHRGDGVDSAQVDNTEVAAHVVASGVGIGVVPCAVATGRPELVRVFPEPVAFNTGFIVYHEAVRDMACVRSAVEALAEMFEEHRELFAGHTAQGGAPPGSAGSDAT